MNTLNTTLGGLDPNLYLQEEGVPIADGTEQQLNQEDFFALLTEQLANQDPTKPVDNDQMVAQMTSFTMADGIQNLNDQFASFSASMTSAQALQASSLIGQDVLVKGNVGFSSDGTGFSGVVVNDRTVQELEITVENQFGEVIRSFDAGTRGEGNIAFEWDGTDQRGNMMPPGEYVIRAQAKVGDQNILLPTAVNRHVHSVSLAGNSQGVILNLDGDVSINLDDVIQIGS